MPMVVDAPGLLMMITGLPRCGSAALARARPVWSVLPPAAQGMIIVIGRSGNCCACAPVVAYAERTVARRNARRLMADSFAWSVSVQRDLRGLNDARPQRDVVLEQGAEL